VPSFRRSRSSKEVISQIYPAKKMAKEVIKKTKSQWKLNNSDFLLIGAIPIAEQGA
jgi:hypothetical protein